MLRQKQKRTGDKGVLTSFFLLPFTKQIFGHLLKLLVMDLNAFAAHTPTGVPFLYQPRARIPSRKLGKVRSWDADSRTPKTNGS